MKPIVAKCTVAHRSTVQLDAAGKASIGLNISEEDAKDFEVGKSYAVSFEETEPEEEDEDETVGKPRVMHTDNVVVAGGQGAPPRGSAANPAEILEQPAGVPSQPGTPGHRPPIGNTQVNPPRP
jgi:hypothetical protein